MAKQQEIPGKTTFHNIKVSDLILMDSRPDTPKSELDIITEFIELSDEGVKVSFGSKPSKSGYSVAVTLPKPGTEKDGMCASFWSGDRYEAWEKAYIATFIYEGGRYGWEHAETQMKSQEEQALAQLAELRRQARQK